jgi:hypothetical protein
VIDVSVSFTVTLCWAQEIVKRADKKKKKVGVTMHMCNWVKLE